VVVLPAFLRCLKNRHNLGRFLSIDDEVVECMNSVFGMCLILVVAYLLSVNRRAIKLRTVVGAFVLQFGVAGFALYTEVGAELLSSVAEVVGFAIVYSKDGIVFLFGDLAAVEKSGFIFVVHVLSAIVFFSALMSVLYYLGVMQWVIKLIGGFLQRVLKTSEAESINSTANIFFGMAEAPLVIRPYINGLTRSELFAVMVGGLATVAGAVMAGYAAIGVSLDYLIAASFMAAPGGLLIAKLMVPETEIPLCQQGKLNFERETEATNVIDAAASGAVSGMQLAMNVGAMLLAFISLIALLNGITGGIANWFGFGDITLQSILGFFMAPFAFLMGVPWEESRLAGAVIGQKVILNEFVAYIDFIQRKDELSPVSQAVVTFALCGFANLASIAICLGSLSSIAPSRRKDIVSLGFKAFVAASLANFMSAAMAGFFLSLKL
jgi:CNT family concentrative nucleoside transporter